MGNEASRLMLQIADKFLILHFEYGILGKNGPPMLHQLRIGATVAAEFGKVVGVYRLPIPKCSEKHEKATSRRSRRT
jgi:hypothetical protein